MDLIGSTLWRTLNSKQINLDFFPVKWKGFEGCFMEKCDVRALLWGRREGEGEGI